MLGCSRVQQLIVAVRGRAGGLGQQPTARGQGTTGNMFLRSVTPEPAAAACRGSAGFLLWQRPAPNFVCKKHLPVMTARLEGDMVKNSRRKLRGKGRQGAACSGRALAKPRRGVALNLQSFEGVGEHKSLWGWGS